MAKTQALHEPLLNVKSETDLEHINQETTSEETSCVSQESILNKEEDKLAQICATYLSDYENSRKTTFYSDSDYISLEQLRLYRFNSSFSWQGLLFLATASFFVSSCFEGNEQRPVATRNAVAICLLNIFAIIVYSADICMQFYFRRPAKPNATESRIDGAIFEIAPISPIVMKYRQRISHPVLLLYFFILAVEMFIFLLSTDNKKRSIWTGALKPIIFFYYSSKARDALKALRPVLSIVSQVVVLELFLTSMFAVIAYQLFGNITNKFSSFDDLSTSFISMFELSTTVVNPSLWIGIYARDKSVAIFFVSFLILMVFYMHSLVLTVVFKSYMKSIASIRKKKVLKREFVLQLIFETLRKVNRYRVDDEVYPNHVISTKSLTKTFQYLRPHYTHAKICTLIEMIDSDQQGFIDINSFRDKLPNVLKMALRRKRPTHKFCSVAIDIFATFHSIINLIYVMIISFVDHHMLSYETLIVVLGAVITFLGTADLFLRIDPFRILPSPAVTRFDYVFDSIACIAAMFSIYALTRSDLKIRYLLIGRAIDLFRITQFFPTFQDIIMTSGNVLPLVVGPLLLVMCTVHFYCYVGMFLWGGRIDVGSVPNIQPFYDLLNFNTYLSGLLTMFQVLVVNDWHQIAKVFLSVGKGWVVYTFFISAITICVTILLNAFLSFFIAAFETENSGTKNEIQMTFGNITTGLKRVGSQRSLTVNRKSFSNFNDRKESFDSSVKELTVFERFDFDKVLQKVTGEGVGKKFSMKEISTFIEVFANLALNLESEIGFLVFNRETMDRHGNAKFKTMTNQFMGDHEIHRVVCSMCDEIFAENRIVNKNISQVFEDPNIPSKILEITATAMKAHSPLVMFVTKMKEKERERIGKEIDSSASEKVHKRRKSMIPLTLFIDEDEDEAENILF